MIKEKEIIIEINNKTVLHNGYFAYDGCHKIYIIEDDEDMKQAKELEYNLYPIEELEETYENSCSLRFINNWKLNETYVKQFENAIFNYIESED